MDLVQEIKRLKAAHQAVILAHYYQDPDIQDLADHLGDSLALARIAQQTSAKVIVFCGVYFMAETAKILNPDKIVLVPEVEASCSLVDNCEPQDFLAFKERHLGHVVVSYINTSAAVKALSDWICTSSNAVKIVEQIPLTTPVIFAPDQNLGRYVQKATGRQNMVLWPGSCIVHENFVEKLIIQQLAKYPEAEFIAHPECSEAVLRLAHYVGSTQALLEYTQKSKVEAFIVGTEVGILHRMQNLSPHKKFIIAEALNTTTCKCSVCPFMKLNTLEKIYACLQNLAPRVELPESLARQALVPLRRMLQVA